MNRFLLHLASMKGVVQAPPDADLKTNRFAAGQKLISDEIQRLLTGFLLREKAAAQYRHTERDEVLHGKFAALVMELLSGLIKMDADHLKDMAWIDSVLLGTCIQSKNEEIRMAVQKLVQRTSPTPNPYPVPVKPQPPAEVKAAPEVESTATSDIESHAALPAPTETELAVENSGVVQEEASSAAISDVAEPEASLHPEGSPVNASAAGASTSAEADDSPAAQELTSAPSDEGVDASLKDDSLPPTNESDAPEVSSTNEPAPAESWNPMSWFSGGSGSPRTSATAPSDPPPIDPSLTDEELEANGESEAPVASDAAVEPCDAASADIQVDEALSDAIPTNESSRADELVVD
jgi:hypothetical protein